MSDVKYQLLRNGIYSEDGCPIDTDTADVSVASNIGGKSRSLSDRDSPHSHLISCVTGGNSYGYGESSITAVVEEEDWEAIGVEREYFPSAEDVGCVLKVSG